MTPLTYQWTVSGAWKRGRKAIVDGDTYYHDRELGALWLMQCLPGGELTWVGAERLEVVPGPVKEPDPCN